MSDIGRDVRVTGVRGMKGDRLLPQPICIDCRGDIGRGAYGFNQWVDFTKAAHTGEDCAYCQHNIAGQVAPSRWIVSETGPDVYRVVLKHSGIGPEWGKDLSYMDAVEMALLWASPGAAYIEEYLSGWESPVYRMERRDGRMVIVDMDGQRFSYE